ncbi:hypothetical protein [Candidatus Entotheonella palauensis]|uniref:hypothetical protein n=1 Tax=Candidatus Entotheonella palauensis TaxID=93172 RepID=UPI00117868FD|nr:hypothetical protein [Candidatus Entotheonella palauensis]
MVTSRDHAASWRQRPGTHDDIHGMSLSAARPQTVYVATARGPYRSGEPLPVELSSVAVGAMAVGPVS